MVWNSRFASQATPASVLALAAMVMAAQPAGAQSPAPAEPLFQRCEMAAPPAGKRWSKRRVARAVQAYRLCLYATQNDALAAYSQVRAHFNDALKNRFPFGPSDRPDAVSADVQDFFARNGAVLEPLRDTLTELLLNPEQITRGNLNPDAVAVLGQLIAVQRLLMAGTPVPPAYTVSVRFLTDASRAPGQDQVIDARIGTPAAFAASPGGPSHFTWTTGEPLAVTLRWAAHAPALPASAATAADSTCQPAADGAWSQAEFAGDWALLRLLRSQAPAPGETDDAASTGIPVAFDVGLCPNRAGASDGAPPPARARIFLRLQISLASGADAAPAPPLALPAFPTDMPELWKRPVP